MIMENSEILVTNRSSCPEKAIKSAYHIIHNPVIPIQCFDIVGWASAYKMLVVGGDDLTALHVLQLQLSPPPPSSLAPTDILVLANPGPPG